MGRPVLVAALLGLSTALVACGSLSLRQQATVASPTPSYVPWLPLTRSAGYPQPPPATPTPPVAIPAGTSSCRASDLDAVWLRASAATGGNVDTPILIRNRGSRSCSLEGYPDVTVLDSAGRSLATATGDGNRGTYFPEWPELPVLLVPGTPVLPKAPTPGFAPARGQAVVQVQWWDCRGPTASRLSLSLPGAGGVLNLAFAFKAPYYPTCDSTTGPH